MKEKNSIRQSDAPFLQPIQSSRFLEINDDWFFFTREKDLLGPYRSKQIVEHAVKVYIKKMQPIDNAGSSNASNANSANNTKRAADKASVDEKLNNDNVVYFKHPNWNL